jgi:hypothetical protein
MSVISFQRKDQSLATRSEYLVPFAFVIDKAMMFPPKKIDREAMSFPRSREAICNGRHSCIAIHNQI